MSFSPQRATNFSNISAKEKLLILLLLVGYLGLFYLSGLIWLWVQDEQYGHGLMVVALLAYIIHSRSDNFALKKPLTNDWISYIVSVIGMLVFLTGEVSGIGVTKMYGFGLFTISLLLVIGGTELLKKMIIPLAIIFLLIPLPSPLGPSLTANLQLISSKIGVWFIRVLGGVVYLEGNTIDMGGVKLLVEEACAGLRYLFPLMSIGAIAAYIMSAPIWLRITIFLVTIPITVLMNSFRIGATGILVDKWGAVHTEGFLHYFEGWVVFIGALLLLISFAWFMLKLIPEKKSFWGVFSFTANVEKRHRIKEPDIERILSQSTTKFIIICIFISLASSLYLSSRGKYYPDVKPLSYFPSKLGNWKANESRLPSIVESVAGASDYYYGDFVNSNNDSVNLYVSYYTNQKNGQIPHSPKVCIPGDGWKIKSIKSIALLDKNKSVFNANRMLVVKGKQTILAYYWIKQGSNMYNNEFNARLDLIRISLFENRTDGALIRLVTKVGEEMHIKQVEERMQNFATELMPVLSEFVPD